jgi:hypothetical protein
MKRAGEIAGLRRQAAAELHALCASFVSEINALLSKTQVVVDPPAYSPDLFEEDRPNVFQINVRGRIVQIVFETTGELVSTEDFRVPYTLCGTIRCFNQQLLEQDLIVEHLLFYCLERTRRFWRFFDERTYRTGPFDRDYLLALLEALV